MNEQNAAALFERLTQIFSHDCDFALRALPLSFGTTVYIASFTNYCDKKYISEALLRPLLRAKGEKDIPTCLCASRLTRFFSPSDCEKELLAGNAVLFYDDADELVLLRTDVKSANSRSISEPAGEVVIRGPREGFVESAETNVALLRKRLKTKALTVEKMTVGRYTDTDVFLVYLDGRAAREVISEVKTRLSKIDLPSVVDSGYLEQCLGDRKYPLFPDVGNSEKPDKVAAKLIGGRVAVICDGSPCVLTLPYFFIESMQSAEDYLKSPYYATFVRLLRFIGFAVALFLPAVYVALLQFDPSAIPHSLYRTIARSRADIPFTPFSELLIILIVFEIIREVGVRMPRAVGDAVSIVAGIILGDAAIKAGIAGAPVIMVAAISATCSFINPPYMNAMPLVRLVNLFFARIFGLFGVAFCMLLLLGTLCVKTSCGLPYLLPLAPLRLKGLSDALVLLPDRALSHNESAVTRARPTERKKFGTKGEKNE